MQPLSTRTQHFTDSVIRRMTRISAKYGAINLSQGFPDLRKLDARAKRPAAIFTYTFGIAAALVLGIGMCLAMKVIGDGSTAMMVLGIVIGLVGIACMSVNYPLYKKFLAKGKQKYAYDIMQLAKEISEQ